MRSIVVLAEAAEDLESARDFYEDRESGLGEYFLRSLLSDIERLAVQHGTHHKQHRCFRMLATRFPFGIYYLDTAGETMVVGILDLRRDPGSIRYIMDQRV